MSEKSTTNSTNPVNEPFPEIFKQLKEHDQVVLKLAWQSNDLSIDKKLDFIGNYIKTQTEEIQKEYHKWLFEFNRKMARQRFETDRNTIPSFIKSQNQVLQKIFDLILKEKPSLDKFYSYALALRGSMDNYGEFLKWAHSEYLDLPNEDEATFNEVNRTLEAKQALQSQRCSIALRYHAKIDNILKQQISSLFLEEVKYNEPRYFYCSNKASICAFNPLTYEVTEVGKFFFSPSCPCQITSIKDKIYAIDYNLKKIEVFDMLSKSFKIESISPPNVNSGGILAHYNDKLCYLSGGNNSSISVLSDGVWTEKPKMNLEINISYGAYVEFNGRFFVIDIHNGNNKIAEYCEPEQQWKHIGNIDTIRQYSGIVCLNNEIYITGGQRQINSHPQNQYSSSNSSIVLTPTNNGLACTNITGMNHARNQHSLIAANGKLYAIGGNGNSNPVKEIEEYDPIRKTWTVVAMMR